MIPGPTPYKLFALQSLNRVLRAAPLQRGTQGRRSPEKQVLVGWEIENVPGGMLYTQDDAAVEVSMHSSALTLHKFVGAKF